MEIMINSLNSDPLSRNRVEIVYFERFIGFSPLERENEQKESEKIDEIPQLRILTVGSR
jgi:hypothetical protein